MIGGWRDVGGDVMLAGTGNSVLIGGSGENILEGGAGNDVLMGGSLINVMMSNDATIRRATSWGAPASISSSPAPATIKCSTTAIRTILSRRCRSKADALATEFDVVLPQPPAIASIPTSRSRTSPGSQCPEC